ncbi:MAG: YbaB/EbfC family nucleoid-associated protein [Deltaproteobacteria bacterium]
MDLQSMMREAKRMQNKIEKIREEAGDKTVEGSAGGGMVVVVCNGRSEIQSVKIEKEVVDPEEIEMLQDLVAAATNQALQRANEMMQSELAKVTGGMSLPGMF